MASTHFILYHSSEGQMFGLDLPFFFFSRFHKAATKVLASRAPTRRHWGESAFKLIQVVGRIQLLVVDLRSVFSSWLSPGTALSF